jgi:hypothetical protein
MTDQELRALVRLAMDIRDMYQLSPDRRAAIRARVLSRLDAPSAPTLGQRLAGIGAQVPLRAPPLSRIGTIALVLLALVGGASSVSAESVPDDPLYALKLNSEQMRLTLARAGADRAAVELGIAESRLREASSLAAQDREAEADAAASAFGEHLANAVASLEESAASSAEMVEQLRARIARQRAQLNGSGDVPDALNVMATLTQDLAKPGVDGSSIANAAALLAERAAGMAKTSVDQIVSQQVRAVPATARPTARTAPTALSSEQRAKLQATAKAAKDAADRARAAAERAKKAAAQKAKQPKASANRDAGDGEAGNSDGERGNSDGEGGDR